MNTRPRSKKGYTFAEVLVASALVGLMAGGAVKMMATMNTSEVTARNGTVALNMLDCAARLWRLGLTAAEVNTVLPSVTNNEFVSNSLVDYTGNSVSFGTPGTASGGTYVGTLETVTISVTAEDPQSTNHRAYSVQVYRPTTR